MKKYDFTIWDSEREKGYVFKIHGYYFWKLMLILNIVVSLAGFMYLLNDIDTVLILTVITEVMVIIKYYSVKKLMLEFHKQAIGMNKHERKRYLGEDSELDLTR